VYLQGIGATRNKFWGRKIGLEQKRWHFYESWRRLLC